MCVLTNGFSSIKTLAGFDFSFQPSLDKNPTRILVQKDASSGLLVCRI
jgi:hypothetical protein